MTKIGSLIAVLLLGSFIFAGILSAQDNGIDRQKAKIVFRVYDITYGTEKICKRHSSQKSEQVSKAVAKFKNTYPELMKLVEQSPYLNRAKKLISEEIESIGKNPEYDVCGSRLGLIQELTDTESGRKMVLDTIAELKK